MFGFRGFTRNHHESSQPVAVQQAGALSMLDADVELVSKEDIYRIPTGGLHQEPILLLKKGHAVALEELPRYIRHGVQPEQFQLRYRNEKRPIRRDMSVQEDVAHSLPERQHMKPASPHPGMQNPMVAPEAPARNRQAGKRVLVMDTDQRSMKRLIDCLFVCGIPLDRIQPLRLPQYLGWALEKHQPDILIVDYRFRRDDSAGLDLLQSLVTLQGLEKIILTLNLDPSPQERLGVTEEAMIRKLRADGRIALLPKPVSRFALISILNSR